MIWKFPKYTDDSSSINWNELALAYSWIADMASVKQNPIHHEKYMFLFIQKWF